MQCLTNLLALRGFSLFILLPQLKSVGRPEICLPSRLLLFCSFSIPSRRAAVLCLGSELTSSMWRQGGSPSCAVQKPSLNDGNNPWGVAVSPSSLGARWSPLTPLEGCDRPSPCQRQHRNVTVLPLPSSEEPWAVGNPLGLSAGDLSASLPQVAPLKVILAL